MSLIQGHLSSSFSDGTHTCTSLILLQETSVNHKNCFNYLFRGNISQLNYFGELYIQRRNVELLPIFRELDAQKFQRPKMEGQCLGMQNQDHILRRSLYFALVHMLQPSCCFLLVKKIFFLLQN